MPNPENVSPHKWQPGQSGNPAGRAPGSRNRSTIVRMWLETHAQDGHDGDMADHITRALIAQAAKGDVQAFKELMDSGYGKVKDEALITHTFKKMDPITMTPSGEPRPGTVEAIPLTFNVGQEPRNNEFRK